MPQEVHRQSNWTNGELDPMMLGRRDIKQYFASAASLENCITQPQGPVLRRPGLAIVDVIRLPMQAVGMTGCTFTAPNGGDTTKLAANDGHALVTTADMGVTDGYVVLEIDFGAPVTLSALDLIDIAVVGDDGGGGTTTPTPAPPGGFNQLALDGLAVLP